jgi:hypothetical protein
VWSQPQLTTLPKRERGTAGVQLLHPPKSGQALAISTRSCPPDDGVIRPNAGSEASAERAHGPNQPSLLAPRLDQIAVFVKHYRSHKTQWNSELIPSVLAPARPNERTQRHQFDEVAGGGRRRCPRDSSVLAGT